MTKKTLFSFKVAIQILIFVKKTAFVHMGEVDDDATLVIMAGFFMKLAEANCSIVSGVYNPKLIVIYRNAEFRRNAGRMAKELSLNDENLIEARSNLVQLDIDAVHAYDQAVKEIEDTIILDYISNNLKALS